MRTFPVARGGGRLKKKLGKLLLGEGLITEPQLTEALEEQVVHGGRLGSILVELGHLAPETLAAVLSRQVGLPAVDSEELQRLLPSLPQLLTREQLTELLGIPLRLDGRTLHIAVVDPGNVAAVDAVQYATDLRLQLYVVAEGLFWSFAEPHLGLERPGFKRGAGRSWARSTPAKQQQPAVARRSGPLVVSRERPAPMKSSAGPPRLAKPTAKAAPPPDEADGPPPLEIPDDLLRDLRSSSDLFGPASQVVGGKAPPTPGGLSAEQLHEFRAEAPQLEGLELEAPPGEYGGLELEAPEGLSFGGLELATSPGEPEEAPELLVGVMLEPEAPGQGEASFEPDYGEPAPPYQEEEDEAAPPYVEEYATEPPPPMEEEDVFASRTMMRPMMVPELFREAALAEAAAAPTAPIEPLSIPPPAATRGARARPGFGSAATRSVTVEVPPEARPPAAPAQEEYEDASDLPTGIVERPAFLFEGDEGGDATAPGQPRPSELFSDDVDPRTVSGVVPLELVPLDEILGDLNAATHREEVADALRAYARGRTERMVLLYLRRDAANGFVCEGRGLAQERVIQLSVPLLEPSAFQRARETRLPYFGPPIPGEPTDIFHGWLGPPAPVEVVVVPIRIDARVVNLLYLDNGVAPLGTAIQFEGLKLSAACAGAYERILARAREGSKA